MGKRSLTKKREKRRKQKIKKRPSSCSSNSDSTSCSTLGSPSSPPPSPVCCDQNIISSTDCKLLGIDEAVFTYEEDEKNGYEMENGQHLVGDELISYLRQSNKKLAQKAKMYYHRFEDTKNENYEIEVKYEEKIKNIREFYRDAIYYSNNRSAVMLKMALTNCSLL